MQFISCLIALIYQGQDYSIKNLANIQGALFVFLTNMTFQNVFGVVNVSLWRISSQFTFFNNFLASQVITSELPIFLREHFNGMYRTDVYFLCKTMADFPIYVVFPFIFITIPYFAIGLNPDVERYFTAAGIVILVANVATSFGTILTLVWLLTSYLC